MRSSLEPHQILSTTTEEKNNSNFLFKEKSYLFNHIDKLAADHNVTVSNTMIKVTYKKTLRDHHDNVVNSLLIKNNVNMSDVCKKKTGVTVHLCNNDISIVPSSVKCRNVAKASPFFHSTPKQLAAPSEKDKEYVNGTNLTLPQNIKNETIVGISQVQKAPVNKHKETSISLKDNPKRKTTGKHNNIKFLKEINSKDRDSIISKNSTVNKIKKPELEVKKLENSLKRKNEERCKKIEIVRRRKSTKVNVNAVTRKIKGSVNKLKELVSSNKKVEESNRNMGTKRAIMLVDPELPSGWTRFIRTKNKGSPNEQHVVYVVSPQGKKFRFKWKLRKFLERTNSSLDADQFFFGLYKRPKPSNVPILGRNEGKEELKANKTAVAPVKKISIKAPSKASDQSSSQEVSKNSEKMFSADGRELLLFDPDLPFGWKRIIHSNTSNGRLQVHIISPEGRIFRRRYRLNEYLTKHQYTHNLDRFYFGLYPKKEGNASGNGIERASRETEQVKSNNPKITKRERKSGRGNESRSKLRDGDLSENNYSNILGKRKLCLILRKIDEVLIKSNGENYEGSVRSQDQPGVAGLKLEAGLSKSLDDSNLPEGWKKVIEIGNRGENSGGMQVVIVSPDGRRHRSRSHLQQYLQNQNLDYNADDFDFSLSEKSNSERKRAETPEPNSPPPTKKKFSQRPVPSLDISSLKEVEVTPEGEVINTVTGLMMSCGLSSARSERRLRIPRAVHEKILRDHLNSEGEVSSEGNQVPIQWIQRLVKCRSDFRALESDAAVVVAEKTKEFIKELSRRALAGSERPKDGLRYEDVAEVVNSSECLLPLQTLIPRKISYKEYVRLNRPKQFMSFT